MSELDQSRVRNRLLRVMSPDDFALLAPHLVFGTKPKGETLFRKDAMLDTVWFLESGIGSLVSISQEGHRVDSGIFGRDGFNPAPLVMGSDRTPYEELIQVSGDCYQLGADVFRIVMSQSASLHPLLLRYVHALSVQVSYTALSNAIHPVDERLGRWLLMCHDRVDGDEILLTHEFMAIMLAVRRPSVTTALHVLEGNGLIENVRGCITIRDRAGLEEFAGDSYGPPEREYERLIGPLG